MKSLDLVAWGWPLEVAFLVVFSAIGSALLPSERFELFLRALPVLSGMIAAQAGAAYFGKRQVNDT